MATTTYPLRLGDELVKVGLVPKGCRSVSLVCDAHSVPVLRYEVLVSDDELSQLQTAIAAALTREPR